MNISFIYISKRYKVIILTHFFGKVGGTVLQRRSAFPKIQKLQGEITEGRHEIRNKTMIDKK